MIDDIPEDSTNCAKSGFNHVAGDYDYVINVQRCVLCGGILPKERKGVSIRPGDEIHVVNGSTALGRNDKFPSCL